MRVKNVNIFKDIEIENLNSIEPIFFDLQKSNISFMPIVARFLENSFSLENKTLEKDNIGRTRISRWLGRENEEKVAWTRNCCGWPSSPRISVV